MEIWQTIVLGLIQGITEFIPVSSSGHLEIFQYFFMSDQADNFHMFVEFINLGTLLALIIYFRKRIVQILKDIFVKHDFTFALKIIITCIPAGLAGLLLADFIEHNDFFSSIITVASAMGIVGIIMMLVDHLPHASKLENETKLSYPRALAIGLAQVLALIPGTSRSGTTIIAGRFAGLDNKHAAEYSFLVSIPIMCGVCLKMFLSSENRDYLFANFGNLALANLVAFVAGALAITFVMRYLAKPKALKTFGAYRIIVSCIVLILALL